MLRFSRSAWASAVPEEPQEDGEPGGRICVRISDPAEVTRLSALIVDVLTEALAKTPDGQGEPPLVERIQAFIRENLGDAGLTPGTIAAAHHISLRSLQKLFRQQGWTVAGWIREHRLERCRRDLTDPALAGQSITAIAARWAFTSPAHFSQAFRRAYGVPPRQFRRTASVRANQKTVRSSGRRRERGREGFTSSS